MTARCRRPKCGRPLRTEESVQRGYGPVCWRREHPPEPRTPRPAAAAVAGHPVDPNQIPLPLEASQMSPDEIHNLIDRLIDTSPRKLADALAAVIGKLEELDGRSADTDEMLDEIRAALESSLV